jgi:hypothetical protein
MNQIIDYAMPCMEAEAALKEVHHAFLADDYEGAISAALLAVKHCSDLVQVLHHMRKIDAIREQAETL